MNSGRVEGHIQDIHRSGSVEIPAIVGGSMEDSFVNSGEIIQNFIIYVPKV